MRKTPVSKSFSTLSFNLRFGLADDGANNWEHRKKALPSLLKTYDPDFIGFQEANDFQIDFLDKILDGYAIIGKFAPAPPNWQNNVIFYKKYWKPLEYHHFFLSRTPTIPSKFRDSRWPRQCTIGVFKSNHRRLICINTHLDFTEDVQTRSAVLIMEYLSNLPDNVPAVLLGDFNATPEQNCFRIFTGKSNKTSLKGPWFKNAASHPFPGTYHGFKGCTNGDHIDWILYRGEITPKKYTVVVNTFEGVYPSDHFPVYAKFKWKDHSG